MVVLAITQNGRVSSYSSYSGTDTPLEEQYGSVFLDVVSGTAHWSPELGGWSPTRHHHHTDAFQKELTSCKLP